MTIALPLDHRNPGRLSRLATKAATAALTLGGFGLAVLLVAFVRTFVFEYFHGDPTAMQGLARLILGN
jgi:hypothetical protein